MSKSPKYFVFILDFLTKILCAFPIPFMCVLHVLPNSPFLILTP
jgi:hypothetical protein